MAVVSYCFSYTPPNSAATPISEDPQELDSSRRQSRIVLPNKKPLKWSTGVAPGEYGGPPTTTKLRKYWGGNDDDPITSDEFIWNKDFMPRMKRTLLQPSSSSSSLQFPPSKTEVFFFLLLLFFFYYFILKEKLLWLLTCDKFEYDLRIFATLIYNFS